MFIFDFFSLLVFTAIIAAVYVHEGFLLGRFLLHRIKGPSAGIAWWPKSAVITHILAALGVLCFLYGYLSSLTGRA